MTRSTSGADRRLIEKVAETGAVVSAAQLERWRAFGLLPPHQRTYMGRSKGSSSSFDISQVYIVNAISTEAKQGRSIEETTLRVLFQHPELDFTEAALKCALCWFVDNNIKSGHREAAEVIRTLQESGAAVDDVEDAASAAIHQHYAKLPSRVRRELFHVTPELPSLAMGAILGLGSVGEELAIASIPAQSESDDFAAEMRNAIAQDFLDISPPSGQLSSSFDPEYQKKRIRESTKEKIYEASDVMRILGNMVRELNLFRIVIPEHEAVIRASHFMSSNVILGLMLRVFSLPTNKDLQWRTDALNLVMLLVQDQALDTWTGIIKSLAELLRPDLESLRSATVKVLAAE